MRGRASCLAAPAGAATDPVRTTIARAFERGTIDAEQQSAYLSTYSAALTTRRSLSGTRRAELTYVIDTVRRFARQRRLTARLAPMFLILQRNRDWWAKAGPPGSGARVSLGGSRVIFQYFPGKGLQLHPLANFGKLNGYWQGKRNADLRSLADDLIELAVDRNGFLAWEYYFAYGGRFATVDLRDGPGNRDAGAGTCRQPPERSRADRDRGPRPRRVRAQHSHRGACAAARRRLVRALQLRSAVVRSERAPSGRERHPHLHGVRPRRHGGRRALPRGGRRGEGASPSFDTGAWSLYSRPSWKPGPEANVNYHVLNRDFSRNLCRGTAEPVYCEAADHFTQYLKQDPTVDPHGAVPAPAVAGRGVRFRFKLSKVGRVGIVVRHGGKTYLSTSASFAHGERYIRWVPPRASDDRTYTYTLFAKDLVGNSASAEGEVRVQGAPKRKARG